jgi:hypothetical protein
MEEEFRNQEALVEAFERVTSIEDLRTLEEIEAYVRGAYLWQQRRGEARLPLSIAEPAVLLEHAVRLSGVEGIPDAALRRAVPVAQQRWERGMWRLREAGIVDSAKEPRRDPRGTVRVQVVWRLADGSRR